MIEQDHNAAFEWFAKFGKLEETQIDWLKTSGVLDICTDQTLMRSLLISLRDFDLKLLEDDQKKLPNDAKFAIIYAAHLEMKPYDPRFKRILETMYFYNQDNLNIVRYIFYFCGNYSLMGRHFLDLAFNLDDPDSFWAIHQDMITKGTEIVTHNQDVKDDVFINVDVTKELVIIKPIHTPITVWHRLFDRLEGLSADELQRLTSYFSEIPLDSINGLKNNKILITLLDSADSLEASYFASNYSLMFREILDRCTKNDTLDLFVQLLVNLQTCKIGKLAGISHTYNDMNNSERLDKTVHLEYMLENEMSDLIKGELRQLREVCLVKILEESLSLPYANPHDLFYLKNVIGDEIGLNKKEEYPEIDINGNNIDKELRSKSKQELLDLFYQHYTIDAIVMFSHDVINNKITIENKYVRIMGTYLKKAFNEDLESYETKFVTLDNQGKLSGFEPEGVREILISMNIFKRSPFTTKVSDHQD